jgi:hypothetical protein
MNPEPTITELRIWAEAWQQYWCDRGSSSSTFFYAAFGDFLNALNGDLTMPPEAPDA